MNKDTNDGCIICYESVSEANKAVIVGCAHEFCESCIRNWTLTSLSCPLCKQEFTTLHHSFKDGKFQEEVFSLPAPPPPTAVEDQLNCLDHNFFLGEVGRLLQSAERIHKTLWDESRTGRGLTSFQKKQLSVAENVCAELRNHKRRLHALLHFDPHVVLQDLYRLQDLLEESLYQTSPTPAPVRYSANDAWEGNVPDEEDDFADDFTYLSVSKVKVPSKGKGHSPRVKAGAGVGNNGGGGNNNNNNNNANNANNANQPKGGRAKNRR